MIKYTKKAIYYNKKNYMHEIEVLKKDFYTLEDAMMFLSVDTLKSYINNKSISTIEEISILYNTDGGIKRLYKRIELDGSIDSNIKE